MLIKKNQLFEKTFQQSRFAPGSKIDAMIMECKPEKAKLILSVKEAESAETAAQIKKYGARDSGAVLVPGEPDDSLLLEAIRYEGAIRMPPDGRLPASVVADFERWIVRGAGDPRVSDAPAVATEATSRETYDFGPGREHWYASLPMAIPDRASTPCSSRRDDRQPIRRR